MPSSPSGQRQHFAPAFVTREQRCVDGARHDSPSATLEVRGGYRERVALPHSRLQELKSKARSMASSYWNFVAEAWKGDQSSRLPSWRADLNERMQGRKKSGLERVWHKEVEDGPNALMPRGAHRRPFCRGSAKAEPPSSFDQSPWSRHCYQLDEWWT